MSRTGGTLNRNLHVLMTADTVGGVWTYSIELARAMGPLGVEVALATMGEPISRSQQQQVDAAPAITSVHESRFKLEWMQDPWNDVGRAGDWLLTLEDELAPDLIHINGYAHAALPWRAPRLVVAHSCVCSWFQAVEREPAGPEWDTYRRAVRAGLRAADLVTAPSQAMLSILRDHYGPFTSWRPVHNARRPELFPPRAAEPFIISAGRLWDQAKNLATLARVAPELDWPVRVAGEARHPDGGQAALENVECLGRLDQDKLADAFGRASIFALPARYEPFGLCALEAALAGCALVLGDIDSLREVWGDAALFVDPEDDRALAAALALLIDDKMLREQMARQAHRRALWYSPERMARGYLPIYRRLVAGRADRRTAVPARQPSH